MGIQDISRELGARLTFPSLVLDDYFIQEFEYSGSLLAKDEFEIGTATAMRLKVKLVDTTGVLKNYNFDSKECGTEIGIMEAGVLNYHSLGFFTVDKAIRSKDTITLECIDRMYKAEIPYTDNLTYPATVMQVLQRACAISGLSLSNDTFANDNYVIPNKPVYENISCRRVFAYAAELAGGYAVINKIGQIEILTLNKLNTGIVEITKDNYITLKFDEVAPALIDKVIVKVGEQGSTKGAGDHPYTIVDNLFVQNPEDVSQAIFEVLNGVNYSPVNLRWQGNWTLNFGDRLLINDEENMKYTYLFERKLTYKGGVREDIRAVNKSDVVKNSTGKGSMTLQIEKIRTDIKVVDGLINQKITDDVEKFSEINQEIGNITLAVADKASKSQFTVLADEVSSKVTQTQVEEMITAVNRAKPNLISNLAENWEQGTLNATTGVIGESIYHIRSKAYFPIRQGQVTFKVSPLYEAMIVVYNNSYGFKESHGFINEFTFLLSENAYFKVVLKRTNGSAIMPEAINTAELKTENNDVGTQWTPYYGDLTLEQQQEFYQLEVTSSNGWTVDSDVYTTTMTAKLLLFNEDVTMQYQAYQFTWYKQYPNGAKLSLGNGTTKTVTGAEFEKSATITCEFEILDTIYLLAVFNGDTILTVANDTLMVIGDYQ